MLSITVANSPHLSSSRNSPWRAAGALALLVLSFAVGVPVAQADTGSGIGKTEITCTHVNFSFEGFANAEKNTVLEFVTVNREVVGSTTFSFNGPSGSNTLPILETPGKYLIDAHATWKTNGVSGGFDHHAKVRCQTGFSVQKLQQIQGSEAGYTTSQLSGKIGQTVDYEVLVKNTGMVPLKFSNFADEHCDEGTISGGSGEAFLAPGESTTFFCERLLTAIGSYSNAATVTGTGETGPPSSETSNTVVTVVPPEPLFSIEKFQRVNGEGEFTTAPLAGGVGAMLEYEIVVPNTGNVPLTFGELTDAKCDPGSFAGGPGMSLLLPGESSTFTCDHLLGIQDTRRGPYLNNATATGTPPPGDGKPVSETSNTVVVNILGGTGTTEIGCHAVVFSYSGFPNAIGNTVNEVVSTGGNVIATNTFVFNGPTGTDTIVLELPPGKYVIDAHATWKTNGAAGGFDHHAKAKCQ